MIKIFGPTYRYSGEVLTKPEIIYVNDHHYDEDNQLFHVKKLLENSTCNPCDHLLIFDHINHEDELTQYNHICLPVFLAAEVDQFINQKIQPDWSHKTKTFNFMINKPRVHRQFLLQLIEHFELNNYSHALAWKNINVNQSLLASKMSANPLYQSISSKQISSIQPTNYKFGPEIEMDQGIRNGNFKNAETYAHLLKSTVFEPSCISLITEPSFFEKETLHTEKTIMAFYGGTLPIWTGGWKLVTHARSLGFDVFDDIIDHSYEQYNDPWDRCYYAIEKNLSLLKDFDRAKTFVDQNHHRLRCNLELVESNPFFTDCINKIKSHPEPAKYALFFITSEFCNRLFHTFKDITALDRWK